MMKDRLMDINELASYLHIQKQTIYNWLHQRKISGIKIGGAWRFDPVKVREWLKSCETAQVMTTKDAGNKE